MRDRLEALVGEIAPAATTTAAPVCHSLQPAVATTGPGHVRSTALHRPSDIAAGVSMVADGREAFALRAAAAQAACRSLDLQYYAWHSDLTGRLLAREALSAADRGVQVRMLLDDVFALGRERTLAALDTHPRVEVRLFNGTRWRRFGRLGFALELLLGGWHLNRRMHNKAWIADGQLAIVGGRNVGDEYFDAAETFNFRDLDLVVVGATAGAVASAFERYWSSSLTRRAGELSAACDAEGGLPALRNILEAAASEPAAGAFLAACPDGASLSRHLGRRLVPVATGAMRVVTDPPEKARRGLGARRRARAAGGLGPEVAEALRGSQHEALLISPYFVPGKAGLDLLLSLVHRGVRVSVVTNSLAATDVVAVHGGYARYRRRLLEAGVEIFELKPSGAEPASMFGSRGASLHTKALAVDDGLVCVGSFNFDPRSAALNTEMGIFADHPALARALRAEHVRLADPVRSWRVTLERGRLAWIDCDVQGRRRALSDEPGASLQRRLLAGLVRMLPIEEQL
ncbi:phospholipase D family protein [Paracraurococcus lichenis]|uniref:Phospholipase D n=1 Tax=Paracraurococcus lichenis TaxID=3064888 RepID=A0ABT9ECV5_9PROT|nr:phospholipase D family protein [Paracraurococcus sp. LOR1-02]MDO9713939.1 phospholipase D family protein [Paracraurococcus sp. LOR1-02]